jgi:hypothetical protein
MLSMDCEGLVIACLYHAEFHEILLLASGWLIILSPKKRSFVKVEAHFSSI